MDLYVQLNILRSKITDPKHVCSCFMFVKGLVLCQTKVLFGKKRRNPHGHTHACTHAHSHPQQYVSYKQMPCNSISPFPI